MGAVPRDPRGGAETPTLRPATPADAPAIAAIWNPIIRDSAITFWPTPRSDADIAGLIADRQGAGQAFMVACGANRVLGFASYAQFRAGAGYARAMEHTIHVAPDQRGSGVGRALMRAIEDHATAAGAHVMIGAITGDNLSSREFHRRIGYAEWGLIPQVGWKFERFHDLVLMGKLLGG